MTSQALLFGASSVTPHGKYAAPLGWWTEIGAPSENRAWNLPNGLVVPGRAPEVFAQFADVATLDANAPEVSALAAQYADLQGTVRRMPVFVDGVDVNAPAVHGAQQLAPVIVTAAWDGWVVLLGVAVLLWILSRVTND